MHLGLSTRAQKSSVGKESGRVEGNEDGQEAAGNGPRQQASGSREVVSESGEIAAMPCVKCWRIQNSIRFLNPWIGSHAGMRLFDGKRHPAREAS